MPSLLSAFRISFGAAILSLLALFTPAISSCFPHILFFIATIAGAPSYFQGPQLRSISLTTLGALFAALLHSLLNLITVSPLPLFLLALPIILFFSALRAHQTLTPLPAVANVLFGLLLISRPLPRSEIPDSLLSTIIDLLIAWFVAVLVNVPFPDRAADAGRDLIANVLLRLSCTIAEIVDSLFIKSNSTNSGGDASVPLEVLVELWGWRGDQETSARNFLEYIDDLHPAGTTRLQEYENLVKALELIEWSRFEPRVLPESKSRWRNVAGWREVITNVRSLVNKVGGLESVLGIEGIDYYALREFFGDVYLPMWRKHLSECAKVCGQLGDVMREATCERVTAKADINGWGRRRAEMYFGFMVRYRLGLRRIGGEVRREAERREGVRVIDLKSLGDMCRSEEIRSLWKKVVVSKSERQPLTYFAFSAQMLSEEIAHVQRAMLLLAKSSDCRGILAPFYFMISAFPELWDRICVIVKGEVSNWQVRFAITHALLLASILALALFLPVVDKFEAAEVAWVFTSAALAAQLSAEPTAFIGAIRVGGTIIGALLGFGFSSLLDTLGRDQRPYVQYFIVPWMFTVTLIALKTVPQKYKYAGFLLIVTNAIMLFCPRATEECSRLLEVRNPECSPNWEYVVSRAANVSIGVIFALLFHLLLWPRFANEVALRCLGRAYINGARMFGKVHRKYFAFGEKRNEDKEDYIDTSKGEAFTMMDAVTRKVLSGDIYRTPPDLLVEIQNTVGTPLSSAMLTVKSEATVWQRGPLKISTLILRILPDFVALTVSLVEMASILGRRPIFSHSYGRSVFEHYISPMLHHYETIQVSLNNLVSSSLRPTLHASQDSLHLCISDLRAAIAHLARVRGQLREDVNKRAVGFKKLSALALARRKPLRLSRAEGPADEVLASLIRADIGEGVKPRLRRVYSDGDLSGKYRNRLCVDDVLVFNAFSFLADGCLSAFIRIAVEVLADLEAREEKKHNKKA